MTVSACGLAAMLLGGQASYAQNYTIKDLGVLGTTRFSIPHSINQNGLVVGESDWVGGGAGKAFLYQNGVMSDLSTAGSLKSIAYSINTTGQIVGYIEDSSGNTHPTLWQNGSAVTLNYPGFAQAINYAGAIAGIYVDSGNINHASLWTPTSPNGVTGSVRSITTGNGSANAVNHFYQVAGSFSVGSATHAFLWDATHGLKDLGDIGGFGQAYATGVSYSGSVTGSFVGPVGGGNTGFHAFVWKPTSANGVTGSVQDLGIGQAASINSSGQIVGVSSNAAALWQNGVLTNLNTAIPAGSGWTLYEADAISDVGQIVGAGSLNGGMSHAFLLTPTH
ncbi:DUF3466 family protein [Capsulimonas corticalis]|nr:DUF3466 family protein [Capsulimonas corticalis]